MHTTDTQTTERDRKPDGWPRWLWRLVRLFWAPLEILRTLNSIDNRLAKIEAESERLGRCIDNHNHQRRYSLTTGHWNDGRGY